MVVCARYADSRARRLPPIRANKCKRSRRARTGNEKKMNARPFERRWIGHQRARVQLITIIIAKRAGKEEVSEIIDERKERVNNFQLERLECMHKEIVENSHLSLSAAAAACRLAAAADKYSARPH